MSSESREPQWLNLYCPNIYMASLLYGISYVEFPKSAAPAKQQVTGLLHFGTTDRAMAAAFLQTVNQGCSHLWGGGVYDTFKKTKHPPIKWQYLRAG